MLANRKTIPIRFIILLAVLILAVCSWRPAAAGLSAQADQIQMNALAGSNGYFKYGEWLPVWVELENNGSDIQGEVQIQINSSGGTIVFGTPVELPSGARKRVVIYTLPNNFSRELSVALVRGGEALARETVDVHPQANITYMIGILAPQRGALALLSAMTLPGQERPKALVDLKTEALSEQPEGLQSFDLIVINDTDTSRFTPEQLSALTRWVQEGGQLVIGGGGGAPRTLAGLPESLLPVRAVNPVNVESDALAPLAAFASESAIAASGPFVAARGQPAADARVLVGSQEFPVIVERSLGSGIIDFVALDLAAAPFNGWPATQQFWEHLIGERGAYPQNMPFDVSPRQFRANSIFYALSNIPSLDLPSIRGISLLLGLYILVVGPLNYLFLRRWRRLHLAWVTIPLLTAIFTAATFGIAYGMRGNDLVLNKIAIVQTQPQGDPTVTTYLGLFSPRQQSYEINVEGQVLVSPMTGYDTGMWNSGGVPSGGQMVFLQGAPSRVRGLTVNQWAMQSFMTEGPWANFGQLTGSLRMENETLTGSVRNETSYAMRDVIVALQNRYVRLGDLAPGEEREVSLGLSNLQNERFGMSLSYRIFQEANPSGQMTREDQLKSNIMSSIFDNAPWSKMLSSTRAPVGSTASTAILVLGWLDQAPPDVTVTGSRLSQLTTTLAYTYLDYSVPERGYVSIPPGLIPGAVTEMPRDSGICMGPSSLSMGAGEAVFTFQIPETLASRDIDRLKLSFWQDSGVPGDIPELALYRWANEDWDMIQEPISGVNVIQDGAQYTSETGQVKVRVTTNSQMYRCLYIDLGLDAVESTEPGG